MNASWSALTSGSRQTVTALIFAVRTFLGQLSPTALPFLDQPSLKIPLLLLSVHIVAPWESISFPLIHQGNTFRSELSGPREWQNPLGSPCIHLQNGIKEESFLSPSLGWYKSQGSLSVSGVGVWVCYHNHIEFIIMTFWPWADYTQLAPGASLGGSRAGWGRESRRTLSEYLLSSLSDKPLTCPLCSFFCINKTVILQRQCLCLKW